MTARETLMTLLGRQVTVTNPAHPASWSGRLLAVADDPSIVIEGRHGERTCLPQAFVVEPADGSACPGHETAPNTCRCACEGCRHNCAAHQDAAQDGGLPVQHCGLERQHPGHKAMRNRRAVQCPGNPPSPAGALRDQLAEALGAAYRKWQRRASRGDGALYASLAGAVLPVIEQHTAQLREKHTAALRHADDINNALMEEVQRYAAGIEQPVLWSVYNDMHKRAITAESELRRVSALHADTERQLRDDLRAEVQQREAAEQQLASARDLADDLHGITGARHIANALDKILTPKEPTP